MNGAHSELEILSLLGCGGFGKVYRGRLVVDGGFTRDVAVKLLHEDKTTPELVARLRDEARTLLLLRDRAIVSAQPPVLLGEHWAVLMEYIDGYSAFEILRQIGPLPLTPAVEIAGEVARALDTSYRQKGPDGQPLCLVHRDIKSANLQITRGGEVKILDFGAATAVFAEREVHTSEQSVVGTPGYVAPERFEGITGPASDIYALGVTLHELVTGERLPRGGLCTSHFARDTSLQAVLVLVADMTDPEPDARPTAQQVQARCRALAESQGGPTLTAWARELPERPMAFDDMVGHSFTMSGLSAPITVRGLDVKSGVIVAVGATGLLGAGLLAATALAALTALVLLWSLSRPDTAAVLEPIELGTAVEQGVAAQGAAEAQPLPEAPSPDEPQPPIDPPAEPETQLEPSTRQPSTPAPAVSGRSVDDAVASEGTGETVNDNVVAEEATAVAAAEVAPVAPPRAPDPTGSWQGEMRGLPLLLTIVSKNGQLSGQAIIDLGTQRLTETLRGSVDPSGTLSFDAGPYTFTGRLQAGRLSGSYRSGRKELPWEAIRQSGD